MRVLSARCWLLVGFLSNWFLTTAGSIMAHSYSLSEMFMRFEHKQRKQAASGFSWQEFNHILDCFERLVLDHLQESAWWLDSSSADVWRSGQWTVSFSPYVSRLLVTPGSHVALWGDLHGSWASLLRSLEIVHKRGYIDDTLHIHPDVQLIFLGDLVDRGPDSIEVLSLVMLLKLKNPHNVTIVRGNHEDGQLNESYGFGKELRDKFGVTPVQLRRVYRVYDLLPVALYLSSGQDKHMCTVLCCHGAFEPGFNAQHILNAPRTVRFASLGKLERFERVSHMPSHLKNALIACFGIPHPWRSVEHHGTVDQLSSYHLQSLTQPYTLGFAWHDFIDDGSNTLVSNRQGRGWVYGRQLTQYLLAVDSSPTNRLIGVFRAHQHNGPMLDALQKNKGITKLWDRLVYTIVSGSCVGGPHVDGAFALVVPGSTQQEWRVYHGGNGFTPI